MTAAVVRAVRGRTSRSRLVTAAVLAALTVVSFAQRPGVTTFDTKLDLTVDPGAFLARALHLWNPEATSGELQNQAYGYLFPVGPYFVLADVLGLPDWVAQRLWCALLLGTAYVGTLLVARAVGIGGIGTEPARHIGALAYALAPRVLTEIGPLSVEMLPAVLLPWVLLPLARAATLGPRRAAALSGLAVFAMGGANAAMVAMALTLPAIWLLTRRWTARNARLAGWWVVSVLAATLWWIVPLLLLAGYSLPFLDYIESAANTTAPLSLFQVLRGTNQWIAYVVQGEPWWPAGFLLVDNPALMLATTAVAGVGLIGLATRGLPERTFLLLGMLIGLALLTVGHVGPLGSPVAEPVRELLDGPLAAFRNVHKFDPVLRLTLTLGFVHAVSGPLPAAARQALLALDGLPVRFAAAGARWLRPAVAALLVVAVAAPAWLLTLRPGQGWTEVPPYWRHAAQWLADRDDDGTGRTLMLPATGFGEYAWGRTVDEPLQALAGSPWAVRNQIPLGSEGNTRFMDAVSDAVNSGRGSPALADFLARGGVRYLLLRNDVDRSLLTLPPVAVQHQALARSPGISLVATFGPSRPAAEPAQLSAVDRDVDHPAIEVYAVDRPAPLATVSPAAELVTVSGGPESVLPLLEQGLLAPGQAAVLAGDTDFDHTDRWVVTDGLRRRERNVGRVQGNLSQTLADTDPVRQERPVLDVLPFGGEEHQTVAQYQGVRAVEASTSAAYADAFGESDPSLMPFAAVDGDRASLWRSSSFTGPVGQWLELQLDTPRVFDTVTVDFVQDLRVGWPVARIRITTDRGSVEHDVPEAAGPAQYPVFGGPSSRVRITVLAMRGDRDNGNVAIRELAVPGVAPARLLRVPADVATRRPPVLAFSRGPQPRAACFPAGRDRGDDRGLRCDSGLVRVGEEPTGIDRRFRITTPALYAVTATVLPRIGPLPWRTFAGLAVTPSSQLGGDPAVSARLAFDRDPATSWIADVTDAEPTLTLSWPGARTIDRISYQPSDLDAANPPLSVKLRAGDEVRTVDLTGRTSATFEPLVTDSVGISFGSVDQLPFAPDGAPDGGTAGAGRASAGLAELHVPALDDLLPREPELAGAACGFGPPIEIDGQRFDTAVTGGQADVTGYRPLQLRPCGALETDGLPLSGGDHRIRTLPTDEFVVHDLTLRPVADPPPPSSQRRSVQVLSWGTAQRELVVGDGPDSYLVVPENANPGWVATLGGATLDRARVDGWQQAWRLPAGAGGTVQLEFRPDRPYRSALLAGGGFVAALLLVALVPAGAVARSLAAVARGGRPPGRPADPARRAGRQGATGPEPTRSWWAGAIVALAMLVLLGGPVPLLALLGCLALRRVWPHVLPPVAAAGVTAAAAIAVTGRLTGHGQDWAFGAWTQLAVLVAVAAVVAAFLYPQPDPDRAPATT